MLRSIWEQLLVHWSEPEIRRWWNMAMEVTLRMQVW